MRRLARKAGWALMGIPTGVRTPSRFLLRWGPYRWGAVLCAWGQNDGSGADG